MKLAAPIHPPLFALSFPFNLFAVNAGIVTIGEAATPTLAVALGSMVVWGLCYLVIRDRDRSSSMATVATLCFFFHTAILEFGDSFFHETKSSFNSQVRVWIWAIIWIALVMAAGWKSKHNRNLTTFFNVAGICSFALATISVGTVLWKQSLPLPDLPANAANAIHDLGKGPDLYYVVLDGYGGAKPLEEIFSFDNSEFLNSLRGRGFFVADQAVTNFCQTEISLASSLNLCGIEGMPRPQGQMGLDRILLDKMIDRSLTAELIRERGYKYLAITTGFPSLRFATADERIEGQSKYSLFVDALLAKTPIRLQYSGVQSQFESRREDINGGFKGLGELSAPTGSPKFTIAHILAPHPPFVFDAKGAAINPKMPFGFWDGNHFMSMGGNVEDYQLGYREQLRYVNRRVIEWLDKLVAINPNAVVILQGDHGPKSELDQDSLAKTNIDEVFPILLAIRAPKKLQSSFYPSMTPVNAMRLTVNFATGAEIPKVPDRSYYSTWEKPLEFTEVTGKLNEPHPSEPVR